MIALFTDFGGSGPYVGQVHAVLHRTAPGVPVVDLFNDVPIYNVRAGAYLLPPYTQGFPVGTVFLCVVDPGVGGARRALMLKADGRWYVGPDNGLLLMVARRAREAVWREILWRPDTLSATFHGRDLFAPVAAELALGRLPPSREIPAPPAPAELWPDDLSEILYVDHYGNALTGVRADQVLSPDAVLRVGDTCISKARTYADVPPGKVFWYANSNGLVEIAVSGGSASQTAGIHIGATIRLE